MTSPALPRCSRVRGDGSGRRRLLLAAALALVGGLLVPASGSAAGVPAPERISAKPFALRLTQTPGTTLAALTATRGTLTLPAIMPTSDLRRHPLCHHDTLSRLNSPLSGFCWEPEDDHDCHEMPQGIATTKDAYGRHYAGPHYVIVSWYHRKDCRDNVNDRAHLTVVSWDGPVPSRYAKVLLVEPVRDRKGKPSFTDIRAVNEHAGGLVWYGNLLYLADTDGGFRVFDVDQIIRTDRSRDIGVLADGRYAAHGFEYVLPQVARTRQVGSNRSFRFSSIGLDRQGAPSIVAAEYGTRRGGRALRFDLNRLTGQLITGRDGVIRATRAYRTPYLGVNGVVSWGGHWWFASSRKATLYSWTPGRSKARAYPWTRSSEGLSYWPDAKGPDLLWNLREEVGGKNVFTVQQRRYG